MYERLLHRTISEKKADGKDIVIKILLIFCTVFSFLLVFVDAVFNDSSGPSDRAGRVFVPQTGPGIRVSVCERGSGYR